MRNLVKLAVILAAVIVFFLSYNTYLLDRSLETLKYSLDAVAKLKTAEAATDVGMLLDYGVLREIAAGKLQPERLANLEYARSVLSAGASRRKVEDVQFVLTELVDAKMKERGRLLSAFDGATRFVAGALERIARPPHLFRWKKKITAVDVTLLDEARSLEDAGKFAEAAAAYERFISGYPDYENMGSVRLRLGFSYQRLGRLSAAQKAYAQVAREFSGKDEGALAAKLLEELSRAQALSAKKRELISKIKEKIVSAAELQQAYYALGLVNVELCEFESAYESFREAIALSPETEQAQRAKLITAWLYKHQKRLEEASKSFDEVIKANPAPEILLSAKYELADLNRTRGDFERAIAGYGEIATEYSDRPIAPLAQYQIGSTYFYDLGDVEAASGAFKVLREKYAVSAYAVKGIGYLKEFEAKEKTFSADYHPVMISWIDKVTPDTCARFAEKTKGIVNALAGKEIKEFSATYTDDELNAFLLKRFSGVLPEQVLSCVFAIKKDCIEAQGAVKLRILPFTFRAKGRLTLADKMLSVHFDELAVNDIPIPKVLLDEAARQMSIALRSEYFPLEFDELIQEEGKLIVSGRLIAVNQ